MKMRNLVAILAVSLPLNMFAAQKAKTAPAAKTENRCGWVDNPTPANWTLTDKDGSWLLHTQGDYQAQGEMPDFGDKWVKTNGNYGYGCACMRAMVDSAKQRVISYEKVKVLPLSRCKADKKLSQKDRA
jgi:hypothetical protein